MGYKYFGGKSWREVTREERYFTAHLAHRYDARPLVRAINLLTALAADENADWEIGYEAAVGRDHWHYRGRLGRPYSSKRTLDIGLFSSGHIIDLEAKAQTSFSSKQVASFERDRTELAKLEGVNRVSVVGLISSRCGIPRSIRAALNAISTWRQLAEIFGDDPVLLRADAIHADSPRSRPRRAASGALVLGGQQIVDAHARGQLMWVGRGGGLHGTNLRNDVKTEVWRQRPYRVILDASVVPNRTGSPAQNSSQRWRREEL
jgi:hypothetical protein